MQRKTVKKLRYLISLLPVMVFAVVISPRQPEQPAAKPPKKELSKVEKLYNKWKAQHELSGGDRDIALPLGGMKGITPPEVRGNGLARLDLENGQVTVQASLPEGKWRAWALYNKQGTSALPDEGDRIVELGPLQSGQLTAAISKEEPVDAIIVSDVHPLEGVSLIGMTTTFQRLYTAKRLKQTPEEGGFSLVKSAHAGVVDPDELIDPLVALGRDIFENETFEGNGRACATCHPASNNFTIDPAFIATLPQSDPLFVNETNPDLADLENSDLLRGLGLILENVDGFDNPGVFRSVNHLLGLSTSIDIPRCSYEDGCEIQTPGGPLVLPYGAPMVFIDVTVSAASGFPMVDEFTDFPVQRTGWGGDGAPGSGSLREFAIGAVIQHFPKTLNREEGVDFRLPTTEELDALELFQLSLGRTEEIKLDNLTFHDPGAAEGKEIFNRFDSEGGTVPAGKCAACHSDAGANIGQLFSDTTSLLGLPPGAVGNNVFGTGVADIGLEEDFAPGVAPRDGGFGLLPMGEGDCIQGRFDISGPFPVFVPDPPGTEPGGFGGKGVAPFFQQDACLEQFNTPPLVEAADTGPFFHNNAAATLEEAIEFYSTPEFNDIHTNQLFGAFLDSGGITIDLTPQESAKIGRFLRVLNAVENLRQTDEMAAGSLAATGADSNDLLKMGILQLKDARRVLSEVGLHPVAVLLINTSITFGNIAKALPPTAPARHTLVQSMQQFGHAAKLLMVHES